MPVKYKNYFLLCSPGLLTTSTESWTRNSVLSRRCAKAALYSFVLWEPAVLKMEMPTNTYDYLAITYGNDPNIFQTSQVKYNLNLVRKILGPGSTDYIYLNSCISDTLNIFLRPELVTNKGADTNKWFAWILLQCTPMKEECISTTSLCVIQLSYSLLKNCIIRIEQASKHHRRDLYYLHWFLVWTLRCSSKDKEGSCICADLRVLTFDTPAIELNCFIEPRSKKWTCIHS